MPAWSLGERVLGRDPQVGGECNKAREAGSNPVARPDMHRPEVPRSLAAARGDSPYTAQSCDPKTHARLSRRDRRDTRPHAHHLLRHPDVRRPTVQGPAAVDGAHAGARSVRPGGQADATLRHLQARRYRRVHAHRPTGSRPTARRSSSGSSASPATRSRSTTATSTSTAPRSTSRTSTAMSRAIRPSRRPSRATPTTGSSRPAMSS